MILSSDAKNLYTYHASSELCIWYIESRALLRRIDVNPLHFFDPKIHFSYDEKWIVMSTSSCDNGSTIFSYSLENLNISNRFRIPRTTTFPPVMEAFKFPDVYVLHTKGGIYVSDPEKEHPVCLDEFGDPQNSSIWKPRYFYVYYQNPPVGSFREQMNWPTPSNPNKFVIPDYKRG